MLTPREVELLLQTLCVDLGFCLPPDEAARLKSAPPTDVRAFADAVFLAEGLDPATADRHLWRKVRDGIAVAFARHEEP